MTTCVENLKTSMVFSFIFQTKQQLEIKLVDEEITSSMQLVSIHDNMPLALQAYRNCSWNATIFYVLVLSLSVLKENKIKNNFGGNNCKHLDKGLIISWFINVPSRSLIDGQRLQHLLVKPRIDGEVTCAWTIIYNTQEWPEQFAVTFFLFWCCACLLWLISFYKEFFPMFPIQINYGTPTYWNQVSPTTLIYMKSDSR